MLLNAKQFLISFFLLLSLTDSFAFAKDLTNPVSRKSLEELAISALDYSLRTQVVQKNSYYLPGEWPTKIHSTLVPALVGVGQMFSSDDEASAFTTASVINTVSIVYLENPHLQNHPVFKKIPIAISKGISTFSRYKDGESYNFYPSRIIDGGLKVHRPIAMTLFPLWYGFTNIPNDADTSSAVFAALAYDKKINLKSSQGSSQRSISGLSQGNFVESKSDVKISEAAWNEVSTFRDLNRSPMFYNDRTGYQNTGAFMTWLFDENDRKMPRFFFASSSKGTRIPFNKNDVDCVVNANILKALALHERKISGGSEACDFLNSVIANNETFSCGIYYPNTYNLPYAMTVASKAGDQCLTQDSRSKMLSMILETQNADGSWENIKNIWKDPVLSTAFAMQTLLEFGDDRDAKVYTALVYGTHFLLKNVEETNGFYKWPAENFFTATAIARSLIMWRSEAYTNGIIANVLLKVQKLYPQLSTQDYLNLKF